MLWVPCFDSYFKLQLINYISSLLFPQTCFVLVFAQLLTTELTRCINFEVEPKLASELSSIVVTDSVIARNLLVFATNKFI